MGSEGLPSDPLWNLLDGGDPSVAVAEKLLQFPNLRCLDVQLPEVRVSPPAVVCFHPQKNWPLAGAKLGPAHISSNALVLPMESLPDVSPGT